MANRNVVDACPRCGEPNKKGKKKCRKCGQSLFLGDVKSMYLPAVVDKLQQQSAASAG